jgi:peptidoglycan/xylan/chitin deacetylase (PgdA/CDA1 family)
VTQARAVILMYHDVNAGPPPLSIDPGLFERQLNQVVAAGVRALTISELGEELRDGALSAPTVAITFDDGYASVVRHAAPALRDRGLHATVFCAAAHLGGENDWSSQAPGTPRKRLAGAEELAALARDGWEIGSHGTHHLPLRGPAATLEAEAVESKRLLERELGATISSYAYPYGVADDPDGAALVRRTYAAACTTRFDFVEPGADPWMLPRIDVHYLRRPRAFEQVIEGRLGPYLRLRRAAARARRMASPDHR